MAKLTLTDPGANFRSTQQIEANNTAIEEAFENTLSRDGTGPNQMEANLDMNNNTIVNAIIAGFELAGEITGGLVLDGNLDVTGNIILTGLVDGRDIAADGTKLDGIETGATADLTGAEIVTLLNNELGDTDWQTGGTSGGSGTVTSVAVSVSDGLTISGSPITTSGTFNLGLNKSSVLTFLNVEDGAEANTVDSVAGETGAISAADLRTALNVEDGATDDQTGAEIVTLLNAELGGTGWQSNAATLGTVTSVAVSGSDGIEVDSGSPITESGTIALGIDAAALRTHINVEDGAQVNAVDSVAGETGAITAADLRTALNVEDGATADQTGTEIVAAINVELGSTTWQGATALYDADFSANGVMVRTASGTYTNRSVAAGSGISVTNGDGVSGNPTIAADLLGLQSLSDPNNDRLLFWDDSAGALTWLTAGTGLTITGTTIEASGSGGSIAVEDSGSSVVGTADTLNFKGPAVVVDDEGSNDAGVTIGHLTEINDESGLTYTLALADAGKIIEMTSSSANTVTIPANSAVAFPVGTLINVTQQGSGQTTVEADTGVTLNGVSAGSTTIDGPYQGAALYKRATDAWVIQGAIATVA